MFFLSKFRIWLLKTDCPLLVHISNSLLQRKLTLPCWAASFWATWDTQQSSGNQWLRGKTQSWGFTMPFLVTECLLLQPWTSVHTHMVCVSAVCVCVKGSGLFNPPPAGPRAGLELSAAAANIPDIFAGFECRGVGTGGAQCSGETSSASMFTSGGVQVQPHAL